MINPLTIPDGWTVDLDSRVEYRFRDADFYEALVATIKAPNGRTYYVEREGSSDLHHEDGRAYHRDHEFRDAFPDGKLPEDGVDGWTWHKNAWFDVYDNHGHMEDPELVAHDVWEAIAQVFGLSDPVEREYTVTYSSMPVTATSPAAAISKHSTSDSGGGEWQAHPVTPFGVDEYATITLVVRGTDLVTDEIDGEKFLRALGGQNLDNVMFWAASTGVTIPALEAGADPDLWG